MQNEILEALESNKFVSLSFTMNGSNIQVCGTARSNKGVTSPPINLIVAPEELDDSLVKLLQGMWCNARRAERKAGIPPEETPENVTPEATEEAAPEETPENVTPEATEEAAAETVAEAEERIGVELDEWE